MWGAGYGLQDQEIWGAGLGNVGNAGAGLGDTGWGHGVHEQDVGVREGV